MLRPLAVLIVVLFGSQNVYAMKRLAQIAADPVFLAAGILVTLSTFIDEDRPNKKLKTVTFVDKPTIHEFDEIEGCPTGTLKPERPKITLKPNSTDGMRMASKFRIRMNEMETSNHVFEMVLALKCLIREKESLATPSLDDETINQFLKVIFNGGDLATAVTTIQNSLPEELTSREYYNLLVNLAAFYPEPILSPNVLDMMLAQTDEELFTTLTLQDESMLSFIINFYLTLKDDPRACLSPEVLSDDLTFILTQGKKQTYRFTQKIKRIVDLVI